MHGTNEYTCPICDEGKITITSERTGPRGFRETEYKLEGTTCGCITVNIYNLAIALEMSADAKKYIKNNICEDCLEEKATIHYPIKAWMGEYKDICPDCFKKELLELEEKYSKQ